MELVLIVHIQKNIATVLFLNGSFEFMANSSNVTMFSPKKKVTEEKSNKQQKTG